MFRLCFVRDVLNALMWREFLIGHSFVDSREVYINTNKVLADYQQIAYNPSLSFPTLLMRISIPLCIACAALLTSCAYEGTIVQKDARPLPFTHTAGIEGSYAFLLKDSTGAVRRQLVTAEVYNQYAIGEYFNDAQPPSARRDVIDPKVVKTPMVAAKKPTATQRLAATRKAIVTRARQVARKPAKPAAARAIAKKPVAPAQKVTPALRAIPVRQTLPPSDASLVYINVDRCR